MEMTGSRPLTANTRSYAIQLAPPNGLPMSPQSDNGSSSATARLPRCDMVVANELDDIQREPELLAAEHLALAGKQRQLHEKAQQINVRQHKDNGKLVVCSTRLFEGLKRAREQNRQLSEELRKADGVRAVNAELKKKLEEQLLVGKRDAEEVQALRGANGRLNSALANASTKEEATQNQLFDLSERNEKLLIEAAELRDTLQSTNAVVSELREESRALQEREQDLTQQLETARGEEEATASQLKDSCRENAALAQAVTDQTSKVTALERTIETQKPSEEIEEANRRLQARLEDMRREYSQAADSHRRETEWLSRQIEEWKQKHKLEKDALTKCEDKRKVEQTQNSRLANKLEESQKQATAMEGKLKAELALAGRTVAGRDRAISSLRAKNRNLEREVQGVRHRMNGAARYADDYDSYRPAEPSVKRRRSRGESNVYRGKQGRY